jgi:hypothetical protein
MANPPRLVVRSHTPVRRFMLIGICTLLALLAALFAYEFGHSRAGFDGWAARNQRADLAAQVKSLDAEVRRLRLRLAATETERTGQTRERTALAKSIGELQAEVARLTSELGFYRGVVGERGVPELIKIEQFRVTRGAAANQYALRLVLGRPLKAEDQISGKIKMTFEGATAATPVNLDLAAVSDVRGGELTFNYRYTKSIDQVITLPAGFAPIRTTVEITPARKGANAMRETFLWNVEAS